MFLSNHWPAHPRQGQRAAVDDLRTGGPGRSPAEPGGPQAGGELDASLSGPASGREIVQGGSGATPPGDGVKMDKAVGTTKHTNHTKENTLEGQRPAHLEGQREHRSKFFRLRVFGVFRGMNHRM